MVFFRSYDRLSHKDARRGISGLHVDSCMKLKSFLCMHRHEGPFRAILVAFWVGFTWQFRGDATVVVPIFYLIRCCIVFTESDILPFTIKETFWKFSAQQEKPEKSHQNSSSFKLPGNFARRNKLPWNRRLLTSRFEISPKIPMTTIRL